MKKYIRKYTFWFLFIITFLLSINPNNPDLSIQHKDFKFRMDYIEHLTFFSLLSFSFFNWKSSLSRFREFQYILLLTIYSGICEYIQFFVPGRSLNSWDLASNILGIISGWICFLFYKLIKAKTDF